MVVKITEEKEGIKLEVTKLAQKGYIARITGPDYKFKMAREFLQKVKVQIIDYGLYEIREGAKGQKQYFYVTSPLFAIPGLQKVFVESKTYNEACTIAESLKEETRRGINVSGSFHERKSYRGPHNLQGDYPDKQIPGNPPVRYDY